MTERKGHYHRYRLISIGTPADHAYVATAVYLPLVEKANRHYGMVRIDTTYYILTIVDGVAVSLLETVPTRRALMHLDSTVNLIDAIKYLPINFWTPGIF